MLLIDTSVAIKWVHDEGESEVVEARRLLTAHRAGATRLLLLDLFAYEFGNVLLRALGQPSSVVVEQLDLMRRLCGPLVHPAPSWFAEAALLGDRYGLTFYDAAWTASARALDCPLVSADRKLLGLGLAISPTMAAATV